MKVTWQSASDKSSATRLGANVSLVDAVNRFSGIYAAKNIEAVLVGPPQEVLIVPGEPFTGNVLRIKIDGATWQPVQPFSGPMTDAVDWFEECKLSLPSTPPAAII